MNFSTVYFNSTTKTVIGFKHDLDKFFQEVFKKIIGLEKDLVG